MQNLRELTRGARLGDGTQVVAQILFGHANTTVTDGEHLLLWVELRGIMCKSAHIFN